MNKKAARGVLIFILIILLCGCGKVSGVVIDKYIIPGHTETVIKPINVFTSNGFTVALVPSTDYIEDQYVLLLDNGKKVIVSEVIYDNFEIGDFFQK